jgi:hypothetical protein
MAVVVSFRSCDSCVKIFLLCCFGLQIRCSFLFLFWFLQPKPPSSVFWFRFLGWCSKASFLQISVASRCLGSVLDRLWIFLPFRRERARSDGEKPELPVSFSAAVPFFGQVPFASCCEGAGSWFCSVCTQVFVFAAQCFGLYFLLPRGDFPCLRFCGAIAPKSRAGLRFLLAARSQIWPGCLCFLPATAQPESPWLVPRRGCLWFPIRNSSHVVFYCQFSVLGSAAAHVPGIQSVFPLWFSLKFFVSFQSCVEFGFLSVWAIWLWSARLRSSSWAIGPNARVFCSRSTLMLVFLACLLGVWWNGQKVLNCFLSDFYQ